MTLPTTLKEMVSLTPPGNLHRSSEVLGEAVISIPDFFDIYYSIEMGWGEA